MIVKTLVLPTYPHGVLALLLACQVPGCTMNAFLGFRVLVHCLLLGCLALLLMILVSCFTACLSGAWLHSGDEEGQQLLSALWLLRRPSQGHERAYTWGAITLLSTVWEVPGPG
jgi:hypothetical protein